MILSDSDIAAEVANGHLVIAPSGPELLQPASVDLRLGPYFVQHVASAQGYIDPADGQAHRLQTITVPRGGYYLIPPGGFALAVTHERVELPPHLAGRWEGKSSIGRLGLATHVTAGFIDPGFRGHITLELVNHAPLPMRLWPGMRIGQLCLMDLSSPAAAPYGEQRTGSRYQDAGPLPGPSRSWQGFTSDAHHPEQ